MFRKPAVLGDENPRTWMEGAFGNPHQLLVEFFLEPNLDEGAGPERRMRAGIVDAGKQIDTPLGGVHLALDAVEARGKAMDGIARRPFRPDGAATPVSHRKQAAEIFIGKSKSDLQPADIDEARHFVRAAYAFAEFG